MSTPKSPIAQQQRPPSSLRQHLLDPSPAKVRVGSTRKRIDTFDFPGYGTYDATATPDSEHLAALSLSMEGPSSSNPSHKLLNELEATSISGNDILSSTFYVSGLVTLTAGKLAPLCLFLVGLVLYLFRGIYAETVTALPCNGGTYNILLNCTSKQFASLAAVFAIISYIATGVVSALTAAAYLQTVWSGADVQAVTISLLGVLCLLTNVGISESAKTAKVIFLVHVATLSVLCVLGVFYCFYNYDTLFDNYTKTDYPSRVVRGETYPGTFFTALFFGFSSAMLGVSGFETSSQFIEEQAPGVFALTLRNMWYGVIIFNPLLSVISFAALTVDEVVDNKDVVLALTAKTIGNWIKKSFRFPDHVEVGNAFSTWVSIDAFVVLSGAVLTSFVGINGLIRRMAMDRCLPQSLLYKNPRTGTDSVILVGFFVLCVSQVLLLDCDVEALGGVYCFAFLSVMTIFAFGNMALKIKRPSLPRAHHVSWTVSVLGFLSVALALLGNVLGKSELLQYFMIYFIFVAIFVAVMFKRVTIM